MTATETSLPAKKFAGMDGLEKGNKGNRASGGE